MDKIYFDKAKEVLLRRRMAAESANDKAMQSMLKITEFKTISDERAKAIINMTRQNADFDKYIKIINDYNIALDGIAAEHGCCLNNYTCKKCNDTGALENGDRCACLINLYHEVIRGATFGSDIKTFTFADSNLPTCEQSDNLSKLYDKLYKFCQDFPSNSKRIIMLSGTVGVGKSYLLSAMANELIARSFSVQYLSAFHLNQLLLAHHTNQLKDGGAFLSAVISCDALFIDDIGAEPIYTNVTAEYLYNILESRSNKHTFFTTNLDLSTDAINKRYGERVFSRVYDKSNCIIVRINGEDLRFK